MKTRTNKKFNYRALAEFRYEIRRFQNLSEQAARAAGIEPQQYQALLAIKGLPDASKATVGVLAERLQIQHHSAVELIDRLESHGHLKRTRSRADRRNVLLRLTHRGEEILRQIALFHRAELRSSGRTILRALETVMAHASREKHSGNDTAPRNSNARTRKSGK
ncbi:MAG TPA: MarR family transcriptional regulator [Candidatus Acidoferrales bacterium]|nr:MarR family transcriptional regulator [Candidatus Acidoferrales bacterium]